MPSNKPSLDELRDLKTFAEQLVLDAGEILLKEQKRVRVVKFKDRQDIATTADLASEKFIIDSIVKKYPNHSILSEEQGETKKKSDFRWVVDPLDGTKEFLRGIPLYNVSLSLEYAGELVVSALYRPQENTLYSSAIGIGSFFDRKTRISVSAISRLEDAFVYCYLPSFNRRPDRYEKAFHELTLVGKKAYRLRALADENSALCWLAQGGIEAYLNLSNPPKWHDIAPGLLIAQEAGAMVKTENDTIIVANNQELYNQIMEVINEK